MSTDQEYMEAVHGSGGGMSELPEAAQTQAKKAAGGLRGMVTHAKGHFNEQGMLGKAGVVAGSAAGLAVGADGVSRTIEGIKEGDLSQIAMGGVETVGGVAGVAYANGFKPHTPVVNAAKNALKHIR